jgi:hypothetical protein
VGVRKRLIDFVSEYLGEEPTVNESGGRDDTAMANVFLMRPRKTFSVPLHPGAALAPSVGPGSQGWSDKCKWE